MVADALSRQNTIMTIFHSAVTDFDKLKDMYKDEIDFSGHWEECLSQTGQSSFKIDKGFLFFHNRLCIPRSEMRNQLIQEIHSSGLSGHFFGHN